MQDLADAHISYYADAISHHRSSDISARSRLGTTPSSRGASDPSRGFILLRVWQRSSEFSHSAITSMAAGILLARGARQ